ncbi:MAG: helix-turn-helix domain-containing protein [Bacteroidetes bacterium]|jgi:transcriptional regulator with XRE-family HTH domain|nr:helix-turn-helix domain-containing protein [Bacteroidota bacterium]
MTFGKKLAEQRKRQNLSQDELAKMVGIHANVLGRYERDLANPSVETATKLAEALEVSLDYLVGKTDLEMDKSIRDKILTIQKLPDEEREHIVFTLDALLRDAKTRSAYGIIR